MGKYRYLIKNVGLMTIGQFGTRFLSFLMVPLYTSVLSTEDYGVFDFLVTLVTLLVPICTVNIYDAVLRFSLDGKQRPSETFAVGMKLFFLGLAVVAGLLLLNNWINLIPLLNDYAILFLLYYAVYAANLILSNYARGIDDVPATVVAGVFSTFALLSFNVLFLLVFRWGLFGYFAANILGVLVGCLFYYVKLRLWRLPHWSCEKKLEREMVRYSTPLILNSVSWWFNSAACRYIIIGFVGMAANGLFSAANKIPSIVSMFANLFNSAWVMSSVKEFDPLDRDGFFGKMFSGFSFVVLAGSSVLIVLAYPLGLFLFRDEFLPAWKLVPLLVLAAAFSAISGCIGSLFAAAKRTSFYSYSTVVGSVTMALLSIALCPILGAMGAVIGTLAGNYAILVVRFLQVRRIIKMRIHLLREHLSYVLLMAQCLIILDVSGMPFLYLIEVALFVLLLLLYSGELRMLINKVSNRKKKAL